MGIGRETARPKAKAKEKVAGPRKAKARERVQLVVVGYVEEITIVTNADREVKGIKVGRVLVPKAAQKVSGVEKVKAASTTFQKIIAGTFGIMGPEKHFAIALKLPRPQERYYAKA